MILLKHLVAVCPHATLGRLALFVEPLNAACEEFSINTPQRQAAFLAQVAHESGEFNYVREIASGAAYEKRVDLGNTPEDDGDGPRYKGRGLIQITGTANYRDCSTALFGDPDMLLYRPELLEDPGNACRSAGWFWETHRLNELADNGDFVRITKIINGGTNGLDKRQEYWAAAKKQLEAA